MILLLSPDLLFASRFRAAAAATGTEAQVALSPAQALDLVRSGILRALWVDLETPGLDIAEFCTALRQTSGTRLLVYGPHVHTERLQAAREAGCDRVLSRGQFDRELPTLLAEFARQSEPTCGSCGDLEAGPHHD